MEKVVFRGIIFLLLFASVVLQIWMWRREIALKPTSRQLKKLKNRTLVRFTGFQNSETLVFKKKVPKDTSTGKRAVVYFFVDDPSPFRMLMNNITSNETKYYFKFEDLDSEKILYRGKDNVIAYLDDFQGKASRVERMGQSSGCSIFKKTFLNLTGVSLLFISTVLLVISACSFLILIHDFSPNVWFGSFVTAILFATAAFIYYGFFYKHPDATR